jgi:hypothetical protein
MAVALAVILAGCRRGGGDGAAAADAGGTFEGTVQMNIPGVEDVTAILEIKGAWVRWSFPGAGGDPSAYRLYDAASRRLFTVLPAQSSVMVDDLPPTQPGGGAPWTFTPIASPGRVAGYPCARLTASDGTRTYELCASPAFPTIPLEYVLPNAASNVPFLADLQARGELPLAVTTKATPGTAFRPPTPMLTALEVRPSKVEGARFEVPKFPVTPGHLYAPRALKH